MKQYLITGKEHSSLWALYGDVDDNWFTSILNTTLQQSRCCHVSQWHCFAFEAFWKASIATPHTSKSFKTTFPKRNKPSKIKTGELMRDMKALILKIFTMVVSILWCSTLFNHVMWFRLSPLTKLKLNVPNGSSAMMKAFRKPHFCFLKQPGRYPSRWSLTVELFSDDA